MGAVSVFTVGNYLNQPSVIFLLCEMLSPSCVVSSVDFFSVELSFVAVLFDVIFYYTSSMIERCNETMSSTKMASVLFRNRRNRRGSASRYCAEVRASFFTFQPAALVLELCCVRVGIHKDGEPIAAS